MHDVTVQQSVAEIRTRPCPDCPLCGTRGDPLYRGLKDRLFGVPGEWRLKKCFNPDCGLIWLDPRPVLEDIGKLYSRYFTHTAPPAVPARLVRLRRKVKASLLASTFQYKADGASKALGWVCARIGPLREAVGGTIMWLDASRRGRLLDVGCGNGHFLSQMQNLGWEVVGVEPDREAVRVARGHTGLAVHQGTLEEVVFPDNSFDAVTMNHVIEHAAHPIRTLMACRRVLKPGGQLVVVTPNTESVGHRLFQEAWVHLDPPRHLHLFSLRTLRACAEEAHLRALRLWTTAYSGRWTWVSSRLIRRNGAVPGGSPQKGALRLRLEALTFQALEHGLCRAMNGGEELVMIATK